MSFLAAPALLLLAALPVLFWLSVNHRSPTRRDIGTHFIWQKIVENSESTNSKTRWFDLFFWLLILAVVTGAISSARPAIAEASGQRQLAVFVERVFQTGSEPQLEHIANKAEEFAGDADVTFYVRGELPVGPLHEAGELQTLQADSTVAARSAFMAMSSDADGRLLFVLRNTDARQRILPRLESSVQTGIIGIDAQGVVIRVRFIGATPKISGATIESNSSGSITLKPNAEIVTVTSGTQIIELTRTSFGVGVGKAWVTRRHQALFKALRADDGAEPDIWLGSDKQTPGLRIAQGNDFELADAEVHIDSTNELFQELPLHQLDWLGEGKLMPAERGVVPLVRVTC
ncbi:MAG: BatA domain-containing protein, partial [Planctomycetota bacterium]